MTEDGLFDVQIWGTVGQWVSIAATLLIAFLSIYFAQAGKRREDARDAEKHVRMLVLGLDEYYPESVESPPAHTKLRLLNAGIAPLKSVSVSLHMFDSMTGQVEPVPWQHSLLRPGEEKREEVPEYVMHESDYAISCTDINDVRWTKTLDGKIERHGLSPRRWWQFWRRGQ